MTKTFITLIFGAAALLAGCDSKPPGCADPETLQTTKSVLTDPLALKPERAAELDPDGVAAGFVAALKLEVSNIVSEGYQADKKKQMCKGMLRVTLPDGKGLEREISYSTQRTVDQKDRFMLEIESAQPIIIQLAFERDAYVGARRWSGNWGGTYACSGIGDAADGPQGPFSMPVTMTVDGTAAKLERVTKGGGVETLTGELNGSLNLAGPGANSADDKWETTFHGQASGRKVAAEGLIRLADGTILRRCKLDLAQGAVAPTAATAAAAATPAPAAAAGGGTKFTGLYAGSGEGSLSVEIGKAGADGKYPVSLGTSSGNCAGAIDGLGTPNGDTLAFVAEKEGQRCQAVLAAKPGGALTVEEGEGCNFFHGAACGFSGDLKRSR